MGEDTKLDEELRRMLELAAKRMPVSLEPGKMPQASSWPWQVPQVPVYTANNSPVVPASN